jgi:hypothetical protein
MKSSLLHALLISAAVFPNPISAVFEISNVHQQSEIDRRRPQTSKRRVRQRRTKNDPDSDTLSNTDAGFTTTMSDDIISFVSTCSADLLSNGALEDGVLSQDEYATYLYTLCDSCDASSGFTGLPTSMQMSFLFTACSSEKNFDKCLEKMLEQEKKGTLFGFESKSNNLENDITALCTSVQSNVSRLGMCE